jgi:hypothetical protein
LLQIFESTPTESYQQRWQRAISEIEDNYLTHLTRLQSLVRAPWVPGSRGAPTGAR